MITEGEINYKIRFKKNLSPNKGLRFLNRIKSDYFLAGSAEASLAGAAIFGVPF